MKNSAAGLLTSLDDLFSTQEERDAAAQPRIEDIPVDLIDDFPNHPFKVRMDGAMVRLVESVGQYGVLEPCLIRPKPDGRYEMVAGHRRKEACIVAGYPSIRCIVQEMTDDQAVIIMVDSNLHREEILPSEKAFAYKMKLEAIKHQGKRTDLTSDQVGPKLAVEEVGRENHDSQTQVKRYIRLTYLAKPILDLVDEGRISFSPGVELSYLTKLEQAELWDIVKSEDCTPSLSQAVRLKKLSQKRELNAERIFEIMSEEKANQKDRVRIEVSQIRKYFPKGYTSQQMEEKILQMLESNYKKRQRNQDTR